MTGTWKYLKGPCISPAFQENSCNADLATFGTKYSLTEAQAEQRLRGHVSRLLTREQYAPLNEHAPHLIDLLHAHVAGNRPAALPDGWELDFSVKIDDANCCAFVRSRITMPLWRDSRMGVSSIENAGAVLGGVLQFGWEISPNCLNAVRRHAHPFMPLTIGTTGISLDLFNPQPDSIVAGVRILQGVLPKLGEVASARDLEPFDASALSSLLISTYSWVQTTDRPSADRSRSGRFDAELKAFARCFQHLVPSQPRTVRFSPTDHPRPRDYRL